MRLVSYSREYCGYRRNLTKKKDTHLSPPAHHYIVIITYVLSLSAIVHYVCSVSHSDEYRGANWYRFSSWLNLNSFMEMVYQHCWHGAHTPTINYVYVNAYIVAVLQTYCVRARYDTVFTYSTST